MLPLPGAGSRPSTRHRGGGRAYGGAAIAGWYLQHQITRPGYEAWYGLWVPLSIPASFRVNGIHSTLLYNGDVLIMAGVGE